MTSKKIDEYKIVSKFLAKFPNPKTRWGYKSALKKFFGFIDKNPDTYIQDVRLMENENRIKVLDEYEDNIESFWADMIAKDTPPKTVTYYIAAVRVFFKNNRIMIDEVFWDNLRRRGNGSEARTRDRPLTNEMLEKILIHGDLKAKALFLTLASSGMRIGEALKLKPVDVDFISNPTKITIPASITKNKSNRITFISNEATRHLLEWLKERDSYLKTAVSRTHIMSFHGLITKSLDNPYLFPFSEDTSREVWIHLIQKAGYDEKDDSTGRYKVHVHCLRKFFRSYFGRSESPNTRDISEVLLGHSGYLNDSYLRFTEEQLKEEYEKAVKHLLIFDRPMTDAEQQKAIDKMQKQMSDMGKVINQLMEGQSRELEDMIETKEAKNTAQDQLEKEVGEEKGTPGQTV